MGEVKREGDSKGVCEIKRVYQIRQSVLSRLYKIIIGRITSKVVHSPATSMSVMTGTGRVGDQYGNCRPNARCARCAQMEEEMVMRVLSGWVVCKGCVEGV